MKGERNFGLDIVRAFAITLVLSNHIISSSFSVQMGIWWYLAYLGVNIFYALSGFLIGGILIKMCDKNTGILSISQTGLFLTRRWFRTIPLYIFMLLVNFIFGKYIFQTVETINWKYFLWLQSFTKPPPSFFGESWTLCIEEWFYFSFALGLCLFTILIRKWKIDLRYKILIFTLGYILLFSFIRFIFSSFTGETLITIFRLDSIGYGVLLALLYYSFKFKFRKFSLAILGLSLSLVGIVLLLSHEKVGEFYILYYNLTGIGLAICVLDSKLYSKWIKKIFNIKFIEFISKVSYSIYLTNLLVIETINYFFYDYINNFFLAFMKLIVTIALSYITYTYIEKPFMIIRDKHFKYN